MSSSSSSASPSKPTKTRKSYAAKVHIKYRPIPMTSIIPETKNSIGCVVLEVLKEAHVAKSKVIFDVLKVTDKELANSSTQQTSINVKVFHNDGCDWPKKANPERGQVMVFKDMKCTMYNGLLEGIVYSTKMVCVCKFDGSSITWHNHSPQSRYKIEKGDQLVQKLFDWWKEEGSFLEILHDHELVCRPAVPPPVFRISKIGPKGCYTFSCKVLKKTMCPASASPRVVLRVCDGTRTCFMFEEINYDPNTDENNIERVYGNVGSPTVDIQVSSDIITSELKELEAGSFVTLKWVVCKEIAVGYRKLVLMVDDDQYMKVLTDDDPRLLDLKNSIRDAGIEEELQGRTEGRISDDNSFFSSEEIDGDLG